MEKVDEEYASAVLRVCMIPESREYREQVAYLDYFSTDAIATLNF